MFSWRLYQLDKPPGVRTNKNGNFKRLSKIDKPVTDLICEDLDEVFWREELAKDVLGRIEDSILERRNLFDSNS